jgi:hypothetical protein
VTSPCACEPVGLKQMAGRLSVQRETAVRWNYRHLLPPPQWRVSRDPAWCWPHQIVPWAERKGKLSS